MFDFPLSGEGQIELAAISEHPHEVIMETCYPVLDEACGSAEFDDRRSGYAEKGRREIRKPVEAERTRLWGRQPPPKAVDTELGRRIQQQTGAPNVTVERSVWKVAREILESEAGEGKKQN